jgi:ACS family hexuronate transporter-like MFS transporter
VWPILITGKFWAVALLIVGAQTCWHLFRVWLPAFLEQGRGYSHDDALNFSSAYYIATDIGCLGAGALSVWLVKRWPITPHRARRIVYALCSTLACASVLVPWLPRGPLLLGVILLVGASALGLFPCYYSFVQDLSSKHVAQLTGILSMWVWAVTSPMHSLFGAMVDRTKSFDLGMALAGLAPLIGVVSLAMLWPKPESDEQAAS